MVHSLDSLFYPRSVAVIGASDKPDNWAARGFLQPLLDFGFAGPIYPVNTSASLVLGLKAYSRVTQVPGPVDYAILSVPLDQVLPCVEDCAARGVKNLCIYTAGFAESGLREGKEHEARLLNIARRNGMRLLGPNCIGIYCPGGGISFSSSVPRRPGNVAYLSQSGRFCNDFISLCEQRGLYFSKVVSYGNALDINEAELLEYLGQDEETKIITAYIEGIRKGPLFAEVLRKTSKVKPVIIIKGGFTEEGRRAALSHTASLGGHEEVWQGLVRQSRAISASDLEEMSDLAMTFSLIQDLRGVRAAVVGAGGGASVLISDALSRAGLKLPAFNEEVQSKLRQFMPFSGTGVTNPVDFSPQTASDPVLTPMAVQTVGNLEEIDMVLVHYMVGRWASAHEERARKFCQGILQVKGKIKKPLVIVMESHGFPEIVKLAYEIKQEWLKAGLCVYPGLSRAAICLGKLARYIELPSVINKKIELLHSP